MKLRYPNYRYLQFSMLPILSLRDFTPFSAALSSRNACFLIFLPVLSSPLSIFHFSSDFLERFRAFLMILLFLSLLFVPYFPIYYVDSQISCSFASREIVLHICRRISYAEARLQDIGANNGCTIV